jgi:hypothetical protein
VPIFDGALKPNQILGAPRPSASSRTPTISPRRQDALVGDGGRSGSVDGESTEIARFDRRVTALCALPRGGIAVALAGEEVRIVGGPRTAPAGSMPAAAPFHAANAIAVRRTEGLP